MVKDGHPAAVASLYISTSINKAKGKVPSNMGPHCLGLVMFSLPDGRVKGLFLVS